MNPKFQPILIATMGILVAIVVVWVRWTYFTPPGWYVPYAEHIPMVMAWLFAAAVSVRFGALIPKSKGWRVTLQAISGILLVGFMVLPVNPDWFHRSKPHYRSIMGPIPGKPREEFLATIRAKPVFATRKEGQYSSDYMVLPPVRGQAVEILCGASYTPWNALVPRDKELVFTVWQTKSVGMHTDDGQEDLVLWVSSLETIQDGDQVIYDARICPLHHQKMERVEVPIFWGLPSAAFMEASKTFSGGPGFVMGGCVVSEDRKTEMAYRCPTCVALHEKWEAAERKRIEELRAKEKK